MSTQRGNNTRSRAQKYKNRHVFKNDLHDKTPQQMRLNSMHISEVCGHCKGVIEWKIKYKKYKPLTQAKTCTRCQQRNITKAYHVLCRDCARTARVCAKCMKSADEVDIEPAQPTTTEEIQLKVEMDRLIKTFPERKRRTFLRYMAKGKAPEEHQDEAATQQDECSKEDTETCEESNEQKEPKRIPHTREELLHKIEQLNLAITNDKDDDDDSEDFDSDTNSDDGCD